MELLGMPEAARRMGVSTLSARRALLNAGVPLIRINERAYAVTAENFAAFLAARQAVGYAGRGRPKQQRNLSVATGTMPNAGNRTVNSTNQGKDPRMFVPQAPNSTYLWRVMNTPEKVKTLLSGGLWLARADQFHDTDPDEGALPEQNYGLFNKFPYAEEHLRGRFAAMPLISYAICWHMSDNDPPQSLWNSFCYDYGVAIRTTPDLLRAVFEPLNGDDGPFYFGKIDYIDRKQDKVPEINFLEVVFVVGTKFRDENEARLLLYLEGAYPKLDGKKGPCGDLLHVNKVQDPRTEMLWPTPYPNTGLYVTGGCADGKAIVLSVDPKQLIEEVIFDSRMSAESKDETMRLFAEYGLADRVRT